MLQKYPTKLEEAGYIIHYLLTMTEAQGVLAIENVTLILFLISGNLEAKCSQICS